MEIKGIKVGGGQEHHLIAVHESFQRRVAVHLGMAGFTGEVVWRVCLEGWVTSSQRQGMMKYIFLSAFWTKVTASVFRDIKAQSTFQ